jgi:hypothetical protein
MTKSSGSSPRVSQKSSATAAGKYTSPSVERSTRLVTCPARDRSAGTNFTALMNTALTPVSTNTGQAVSKRNGNASVRMPAPVWNSLRVVSGRAAVARA